MRAYLPAYELVVPQTLGDALALLRDEPGAWRPFAGGSGRVGYQDFDTGCKQPVLRADELIARVRLPRPRAGARHFYRKVGTRRAQAISKVCFAALAERDGGVISEVRVALGSVAP